MDEADALILDRNLQIRPYGKHYSPVIGLTATGIVDMEQFEGEHFKTLGYEQVDSTLRTEYRHDERPVHSGLEEFFGDAYHGTVRLLYADESREEEMRKLAVECGYTEEEILVNPEDIAELRVLRAPMFLLVTKAANMRGLDYRSTDKITLFLAKKCDSRRSLR